MQTLITSAFAANLIKCELIDNESLDAVSYQLSVHAFRRVYYWSTGQSSAHRHPNMITHFRGNLAAALETGHVLVIAGKTIDGARE